MVPTGEWQLRITSLVDLAETHSGVSFCAKQGSSFTEESLGEERWPASSGIGHPHHGQGEAPEESWETAVSPGHFHLNAEGRELGRGGGE